MPSTPTLIVDTHLVNEGCELDGDLRIADGCIVGIGAGFTWCRMQRSRISFAGCRVVVNGGSYVVGMPQVPHLAFVL